MFRLLVRSYPCGRAAALERRSPMNHRLPLLLWLAGAIILMLAGALPAATQTLPGNPADVFNLFEGLPFRSATWSTIRTTLRQGQTTRVQERYFLKGSLLKMITTATNGDVTVIYADNRDKSLVLYQPATNAGLRLDLREMAGMLGSTPGDRSAKKIGTARILDYDCEVVEAQATLNIMGFALRVRYKDWLWQGFPLKSVVSVPDLEVSESVLPGSVTTVEVTALHPNAPVADRELAIPSGARIDAAPGQLPLFLPGGGGQLPF